MGVEKGLDCTNAYRLLIARTVAWTSQAEVELADSEPAASYLLLDVHVPFVSSAHYGAGCYFDIRKSESLVVVVVRCSLFVVRCSLLSLCVCVCCCVWCVLYVALCQVLWCVAAACCHGTFQNVSLSTHVNFDSVILSDLDLSARLFALTKGRGLATHRYWGPLCVYPVALMPTLAV